MDTYGVKHLPLTSIINIAKSSEIARKIELVFRELGVHGNIPDVVYHDFGGVCHGVEVKNCCRKMSTYLYNQRGWPVGRPPWGYSQLSDLRYY